MVLEAVLTVLLGDVRSVFFVRILAILNALAPCSVVGGAVDVACMTEHRRAAAVITIVALEDDEPEDAGARLAGAGGHETGFRTKLQKHGPAVTWFQLEVPGERERYLADDLLAARRALEIARGCHGSMVGYACGHCVSRAPRVLEAAGQLRSCVESARRGGAWVCRNWRAPKPPKPPKAPRRALKKGRRLSA